MWIVNDIGEPWNADMFLSFTIEPSEYGEDEYRIIGLLPLQDEDGYFNTGVTLSDGYESEFEAKIELRSLVRAMQGNKSCFIFKEGNRQGEVISMTDLFERWGLPTEDNNKGDE